MQRGHARTPTGATSAAARVEVQSIVAPEPDARFKETAPRTPVGALGQLTVRST
jgi:hypothetical protein